MASLLGKADPTLVTAAARAGLANVPGDYSKQFGIMSDANKALLGGVEKAFKQYETGLKVDKLKLDTAISDLQKYGVGIENNADSKKFNGEMDGQVAIWNENDGFKNDRQGLNEWERQNNKIMSKYKNNKTAMIEAVEAYQSNDSWTEGLLKQPDGKQIIGFFKNLTDYSKNTGDKSGIHNEKADNYMANNTGAEDDITPVQLWEHLGAKEGEMVKYHDPVTNEFAYITSVDGKVISKKSSEISKLIPQKAIKQETDIHTEINAKIEKSTGTYSDNDSQATQNWLESLIDNAIEGGNEHALQYLMGQKYGGMETSFIDALKSGTAEISPAIIKSLEGAGYLGDVNKDKMMDKGDFVTTENYDAMVDKILYGEDTYELRRNLFVDDVDNRGFRPGIEQKVQEGKFNTLESFLGYKKKLPTMYGGHSLPSTFHGAAQQIQNRLDGTVEDDWLYSVLSPNRFKLKDGQWYMATPSDNKEDKKERKGFTKKQKVTLGYVKGDLSLSDYDNIFFPEQKKAAIVNEEGDIEGINNPAANAPSKNVPPTKPVAETVSNSGLKGITEDPVGGGSSLFRYYNYDGDDITAADAALTAAKKAGIDDAFLKYENDGKQISLEVYSRLKDKSNVTFKVQLGVGKKSIAGEGTEAPSVAALPDTTGTPSDSTIVTQPDTSVVETPPVDVEDQDYGPDNPDPMTGHLNTSGDEIINESGEYIPIDSDEGKKIAKNYLGMKEEVTVTGVKEISSELKKGETPVIANTTEEISKEVVENNPVIIENIENPNGNTNPIEYIVNNGYLNVNEAETDSPLVKSIEDVYKELLGTRKDSLAVTKSLTHDDKAWCGAFVYDVLTKTGAMETGDRVQSEEAYNKLRAAEYLNVGTPVDLKTEDPKMGDIIVVSRMVGGEKKYHVAFYSGTDKNGNVIMLGGNQDDQVSFKTVTDNYTIEGYRRMENMSDIKEATAVGYKAEYGVKGGKGKLI